jgi:DNA-binding PadR family transcriptional regulator
MFPSQTEQYILLVLRGASGVYGLDIQRAFSESSEGQESISVGSLYSLLKRLKSKGLVDSFQGNSISGGAKRQYYLLTEKGESVVKSSENFIRKLSEWTPKNNE